MLKNYGLHTYVLNNNIKALGLLGGFLLVIQLMFASIWAASAPFFFTLQTKQAFFAHVIVMTVEQAPAVLVGSLVWAFLAFIYSKSILRGMTGLQPTSRLAEPRLHNIVENLSVATGLTTPRIEISESSKLNAFAMGLSPATSSIGVTRGLLISLNDRELEAVIAHELTHIRTLDVRLMTLATIFCGIIFSLGWFLTYRMRELFRQTKNKPIVLLPVAIYGAVLSQVLPGGFPWHIMAVTAGLIMSALLISLGLRFAISRTREYVADLGACELTQNPEALISALAKIHGRNLIPNCDPTVQAMMISAPSEGFFASHPRLEDRIDAIVAYAATHLNGLRLAPASVRFLPQVDESEMQSGFSIADMKYPAWVSKPLIVIPALFCGGFTYLLCQHGLPYIANAMTQLPQTLADIVTAQPGVSNSTFSSTAGSGDLRGTIDPGSSPALSPLNFIRNMSPGEWKVMMIYGFISIAIICCAKLLRSFGFDAPILRQLSGGPSKEMQSDWDEPALPENTRINAAIARAPANQSHPTLSLASANQRPSFGKAPARSKTDVY
jgi:heat shock protein HtpX